MIWHAVALSFLLLSFSLLFTCLIWILVYAAAMQFIQIPVQNPEALVIEKLMQCRGEISCLRIGNSILPFWDDSGRPLLTVQSIVMLHTVFAATVAMVIYTFNRSIHSQFEHFSNERMRTLLMSYHSVFSKYQFHLVRRKVPAFTGFPYTRFSTIYVQAQHIAKKDIVVPMLLHEIAHLTRLGNSEPIVFFVLSSLRIALPIFVSPFAVALASVLPWIGPAVALVVLWLPFYFISTLRRKLVHTVEIAMDCDAASSSSSELMLEALKLLAASDNPIVLTRIEAAKGGIASQKKFVQSNLESYLRLGGLLGLVSTAVICTIEPIFPTAFGLNGYLKFYTIAIPAMFLFSLIRMPYLFDFEFSAKLNHVTVLKSILLIGGVTLFPVLMLSVGLEPVFREFGIDVWPIWIRLIARTFLTQNGSLCFMLCFFLSILVCNTKLEPFKK